MSKKPPNRPGITFEIGARLEALDYLQKWYGKYRRAPEVKPSVCSLHVDVKTPALLCPLKHPFSLLPEDPEASQRVHRNCGAA